MFSVDANAVVAVAATLVIIVDVAVAVVEMREIPRNSSSEIES